MNHSESRTADARAAGLRLADDADDALPSAELPGKFQFPVRLLAHSHRTNQELDARPSAGKVRLDHCHRPGRYGVVEITGRTSTSGERRSGEAKSPGHGEGRRAVARSGRGARRVQTLTKVLSSATQQRRSGRVAPQPAPHSTKWQLTPPRPRTSAFSALPLLAPPHCCCCCGGGSGSACVQAARRGCGGGSSSAHAQSTHGPPHPLLFHPCRRLPLPGECERDTAMREAAAPGASSLSPTPVCLSLSLSLWLSLSLSVSLSLSLRDQLTDTTQTQPQGLVCWIVCCELCRGS